MNLTSQNHLYLKRNLLFTHEVAFKLNKSKQTVLNLQHTGELVPVKSMANSNVYLWEDVLAYMDKAGLLRVSKPNLPAFMCESSTSGKNVMFAKEHLPLMKKIVRVSVYSERIDAALENYYLVSDRQRQGDLVGVDVPLMILHDEAGQEMWLPGCGCGYRGAGPNASIRVLSLIDGISEADSKLVNNHRIVKYIRNEDNAWDVYGVDSHFGLTEDSNTYDDVLEHRRINAKLFSHRDGLTLIQDKTDYLMHDKSPEQRVLEKFSAFIPNPIEFTLFLSYEQAIERGYYDPYHHYGHGQSGQAYRLIIKDVSGRQLWLDPNMEENKHLSRQPHLLPLLQACGFEISEETLDEKLKGWFKAILNKVEPPDEEGPIVVKKSKMGRGSQT